MGGPEAAADNRVPGAEVEGGRWGRGGLLKAAAGAEDMGGGREVPSGGTEGTGEGGTRGADGLPGARDG